MPYSVSSWFIDTAASVAPTIKRTFTIAGSDYSSRVQGWPTISQKWDNLKPTTITLGLANNDGGLNFFKTDKTNLRSQCIIKFGFTHASSGDELITMFSGKSSRVVFEDGKLMLTMDDKLRQLAERLIGASQSAYVWPASYYPSDIAWAVCTSFGGLSSVASTSNPDIDYTAYTTWKALFSGDSIIMGGRSEGKSCLEILRNLARHTRSAIFMKEDKLSFNRFTTANTDTTMLDNNSIVKTSLSIDDTDIINKQWVYANYDATSRYWPINVHDVKSASVNSFGLRENVEKDETVWYVNSLSALNLAQRITQTAGLPYDRLMVETTLVPIHRHLGEIVQTIDVQIDVSEGWRIMQRDFNLDTGRIKLTVDVSQINTPFLLDVSSLDGSDLLL